MSVATWLGIPPRVCAVAATLGSALVTGVKIAAALIGYVGGVIAAFVCGYWVTRLDGTLAHSAVGHFFRFGKPPTPRAEVLLQARAYMLMLCLGAAFLVRDCGKALRAHWDTLVRRQPAAGDNEELRASRRDLEQARAKLARALAESEGLKNEHARVLELLRAPAIRRAVLHCWHPDKAATETQRKTFAERFKEADALFKRLRVTEEG
jgi:hypothetical protein